MIIKYKKSINVITVVASIAVFGCQNVDVQWYKTGTYSFYASNNVQHSELFFNDNSTFNVSKISNLDSINKKEKGRWFVEKPFDLDENGNESDYSVLIEWNNCYFENCSWTECIAGCIYLNNECDVFSNSEDILFKNLSGLGMFLRFYESGRDYFAELVFTPSGYESMFYTFVLNV